MGYITIVSSKNRLLKNARGLLRGKEMRGVKNIKVSTICLFDLGQLFLAIVTAFIQGIVKLERHWGFCLEVCWRLLYVLDLIVALRLVLPISGRVVLILHLAWLKAKFLGITPLEKSRPIHVLLTPIILYPSLKELKEDFFEFFNLIVGVSPCLDCFELCAAFDLHHV